MDAIVNNSPFPDDLKEKMKNFKGNKREMLEILLEVSDIANRELEAIFKSMGATDEEFELSKKVNADIFSFETTNDEILQYIRDHKEELRALK